MVLGPQPLLHTGDQIAGRQLRPHLEHVPKLPFVEGLLGPELGLQHGPIGVGGITAPQPALLDAPAGLPRRAAAGQDQERHAAASGQILHPLALITAEEGGIHHHRVPGGQDPGGLLRQLPFVEVGAHRAPVGIPLQGARPPGPRRRSGACAPRRS